MPKIRVRARAVEMLGRQQIAGLPTAISELFKNAHDAYAQSVEVDYYNADRLFVLRDNGIGMTREEFEQRWLTLGTDSKTATAGALSLPPIDPNLPIRALIGEKGIGRLAAAAIGDQLLVLTQPKKLGDHRRLVSLTVAYLHWGVFALPGLDLDQIEIPVEEFDPGSLPGLSDVRRLVKSAEIALKQESKKRKVPEHVIKSILDSMNSFDIDPSEIAKFLTYGPLLNDATSHGTHLYVRPADPILEADLKALDDDAQASPLVKVLIGFTNTMIPGAKSPPITACFRQHSVDGTVDEKLAGSQFFTASEFQGADHHFQGSFDEHGQFNGKVAVYGAKPIRYVASWTGGDGSKTKCGPFDINIAYVQGTARESRIPPDEWARITAKLNKIGGLYIYRNGIRILPYGDSDYDFLDIERRRTKSAGYYFFSYRRMFGVIDITRDQNAGLVEKAGREGFRQNVAYRQFKGILENFFVQLAADFFREGGTYTDAYELAKSEYDRKERARRQRETDAKSKRLEFRQKLEAFFNNMERGHYVRSVEKLCGETEERVTALMRSRNPDSAAQQLMKVQEEVQNEFNSIHQACTISKPRGWGLTKELNRDYEVYLSELEQLRRELLTPAEAAISDRITAALTKLGSAHDERSVAMQYLEGVRNAAESRLRKSESTVRDELKALDERAVTAAKHSIVAVKEAIDSIVADAASTDFSDRSTTDLGLLHRRWSDSITHVVDRECSRLVLLAEQLHDAATPAAFDRVNVTEILEEELEEFRERQLAHYELVQIGMALNVINHEFRASVRSLRENLRSLKRWSDSNPSLRKLYNQIRASFDHLDGYLTLFTPLSRRLYRRKVEIRGHEIASFVTSLFSERIQRHSITLDATDAFRAFIFFEYPSSIYPCFVNLIDNAIYWISDMKTERRITLDAQSNTVIISDTGPGIKMRDRPSIFEQGFTRKPGGQGLGLYVTKETLSRIGYELTVDDYVRGTGAVFRIRKISDSSESDADSEE